jgi:hypothetical protein
MSPAASTTHHMQQIPPPQLPWHGPEIPARPTVIPMLPTRIQQPGRQAPLPDAVAVRQCPVPDTAPPFDAEIALATTPDRNGPDTVSEPDRDVPDRDVPDDDVADPDVPDPDVPDDDVADVDVADVDVAHADESERGDPVPAGWPSQFAQVLAETLAGSRPVRQLTPWTTEQARRRIRQLGPMMATDQRPRVRRIMTSAPAANVLEMTAVVGFGPRVRVLALRLEREQPRAHRDGGSRWCCTAIESA